MRRSEKKNNVSFLISRRQIAGRLDDFELQKTKPIWRKKPSYVHWLSAIVFVVVFVLALGVLLHASPPGSRGARPIALGNGYTSVSEDVYSLYYNPAGLYTLNQKEVAADYGRSYSVGEPARSDFNFIYGTPYHFRGKIYPAAMALYTESPAQGAHIIDLTAGAAMEAPLEKFTRGILKFQAKAGVAVTLRNQGGELKSDRVGKSSLGLGVTGGMMFPIDRKHQAGVAIRNLFNPGAYPDGPSIHVGVRRYHSDLLHMFADLEFSNGGIWRFHPGLEWLFARGVLRPRAGWGFRDNGQIDSLATGVGFYLSPVQIDISYLIPLKTVVDNAGQLRASLIYRFGRPQFSEIYYDRALEQASRLDQNVLIMTSREAELKASLAELEQKKHMAKEEMESAKSRIEALKNKDLLGERDAVIRDLRARIRALEGSLSSEKTTVKSLREKKNTVRTHTVQAGETLQSIAREYYGDPNLWKRIYNANPDKIERGLPKVGAALVIP